MNKCICSARHTQSARGAPTQTYKYCTRLYYSHTAHNISPTHRTRVRRSCLVRMRWPVAFVAALAAAQAPPPLSAAELRAYAEMPKHEQLRWSRGDASGSKKHALLEQAAQLHQEGDMDAAVDSLKKVLRDDASNIEAYASLAKVLDDQGKQDLADRARAKARKIAHELAKHVPF